MLSRLSFGRAAINALLLLLQLLVPCLCTSLLPFDLPFTVILDSVGPVEFDVFPWESYPDALERVTRARNLDGDELEAKVRRHMQERGALPLSIEYITHHGVEVAPIKVYTDSHVEELVRRALVPLNASEHDVSTAVDDLEASLERKGFGPELRRFPLGDLYRPDRVAALFRTFRRIKVATHTVFDENADALVHAIRRHSEATGRVVRVDKVASADVDQYEEDVLYLMFPVIHPRPLPRFYVAIQMEQFAFYPRFGSVYMRKLQAALEVWDFSTLNLPVLESNGIQHARHVPVSIAQPPEPMTLQRSWHVTFFGSRSLRRSLLLSSIQSTLEHANPDLRVSLGQRIWGEDRFSTLISLNVHHDDRAILEAHRILPLIVRGVWVISEPSEDPYYVDRLSDVIDFVPADQIAARALDVLQMDPEEFLKELERRRDKVLAEWEAYKIMEASGALRFLWQRVNVSTIWPSDAGPGPSE